MRGATALLLGSLPFSALAQTSDSEQLSAYRACARAHAFEAQAAGVRTPDGAVAYFGKVCLPAPGLLLGSRAGSNEKLEALVPRMLRHSERNGLLSAKALVRDKYSSAARSF